MICCWPLRLAGQYQSLCCHHHSCSRHDIATHQQRAPAACLHLVQLEEDHSFRLQQLQAPHPPALQAQVAVVLLRLLVLVVLVVVERLVLAVGVIAGLAAVQWTVERPGPLWELVPVVVAAAWHCPCCRQLSTAALPCPVA